MKFRYLATLSFAVFSSAHAAVTFHSDFDEASLDAITGLNIDTPNGDLGTANSGTVALDTVNQALGLASNGANLWTVREGAPIAWVSSPAVTTGATWYVQTRLTHIDSPGGTASGYDQSGITFYSGTAGNNPGSENTGTHQSLFVGLSDWNQWHHRIQGFADNNPNVSVGASGAGGAGTFGYRVEITENGTSDLYNFFYRENSSDSWTQFGPADLSQDFDNSAVGLYLKANNANTTAATEFDYLTVGTIDQIPEPSTGILAGLAGLSLVMRRRRK